MQVAERPKDLELKSSVDFACENLTKAGDSMTTMMRASASDLQWQQEPVAAGGIVVGFDGSPASYAAIESASVIAAEKKCAVHVVSVLQPMSAYKTDLTLDQPQSEIEDLRIQIRDAAIRDAIGQASNRRDWTHRVEIGSPAMKIAEAADERSADLIVLGRAQRGARQSLAKVETMRRVMQRTSVPVLVVAEGMKKPVTVVAAVDFSSASWRAAAAGLQMLEGSGTLYLVHVDEPMQILPDGLPSRPLNATPDDVLGLLQRNAVALRALPGVVVESVVLSGKPSRAIAKFCDRVGADLLMVGTRGLAMATMATMAAAQALTRAPEAPAQLSAEETCTPL